MSAENANAGALAAAKNANPDALAQTDCRIINKTGKALTFVVSKDWVGKLGYSRLVLGEQDSDGPLLVHFGEIPPDNSSGGSVGFVVYRYKHKDGVQKDWCIAWSNKGERNKVWTRIDQPDANWYKLVDLKDSECNYNDPGKILKAHVEIEAAKTHAKLTATLSLFK
ncbi:hypothetical protein QUC31_010362 [Theobroma cacao]